MVGVELGFRKWTARINEQLTFLLMKIKEKNDITEKDYELLRVLHRLWFLGEYPVYAHENSTLKEEKVTEQGLFDMSNQPIKDAGTEVEDAPLD